MFAVVLAGGIAQPSDRLYPYSKGEPKALIDVAGRPMIQWVIDALDGASRVQEIIVVGLGAKSNLPSRKPIHYLSGQGRSLANLLAGLEETAALDPEAKRILFLTADVPAIKSEMVDWFVETSVPRRADLHVGGCPRPLMEKRYPLSRPAYIRFKDMELCAAGLGVAHVDLIRGSRWEALEKVVENGAHPMKLAGLLGVGLATRLGLGRLRLEEAAEAVSERLGIRIQPIVWNAAEPSLDANTPEHLEILRRELRKRLRPAPVRPKGTRRTSTRSTGKVAKRKSARKRAGTSGPRPRTAPRGTSGRRASLPRRSTSTKRRSK